MKKIKYIMIVTIFFMFITIMTEVKVYNSDFLINVGDCNTYYAFNLESHDEKRNQKFLSIFRRKAEERGLGIYVVYQKIQNYNQKNYVIYANQKSEDMLKKRLQMYDHLIYIDSFFMGNAKLEFKDFQELKLKNMYCIQFFGDIEKAREIRNELVSTFDSSAVYPGQDLKDIYFTEHAILGIFLVLVLLAAIYYATVIKKEYTVRFILGESVKSRVMKNLLFDGFVLAVLLGSILFGYRWHFGDQINIKYYSMVIFMFIFISSIPELFFMVVNFKKNLTKTSTFLGFRTFSYIIKCVMSVVIIFLVSSNIFLIVKGVDVINQEDNWRKLENYKSIYIPVSDADESVLKKEFFYLGENYNYKKYKNSLLRVLENRVGLEFYLENYKRVFIFGVQMLEGKPDTYLLNRNALDLVLKNEPEIQKLVKDKKTAILYPKGKKKFVDTDVKNLDSNDIIQYDQHIKLFNYDRKSRLISENSYLKDPIIYLIDSKPEASVKYNIGTIKNENETKLSLDEPYYSIERILFAPSESIYFDMNGKDKDYQSFIKKREQYVDEFNIEENDIYKLYQEEKKIYTHILYINSVMLILLLLLDLFLLQLILKMEVQINSKEVSLKKILGYNKRERYKNIYLSSWIASAVSFVSILILLILFKGSYIYYAIIGFLLTIFIEQLVLYRVVSKYEKENIPIILKGARV